MDVRRKLEILADAAKYDASCASSGSKRSGGGGKGIGSTDGVGICHSYTPDGRCVSLLKILFTNRCVFDCRYCINRASSNVERAAFSVEEVVWLTMEMYRRNYIEGLFLSSGIVRTADWTMEQLVEVARRLRQDEGFGGYIHLKAIAGASPELLVKAGAVADRLSCNVELPTEADLATLAPEKRASEIDGSMRTIHEGVREAKENQRRSKKAPVFAPAGQSTQMVVGATPTPDLTILERAHDLYRGRGLRRVYYSAYSPVEDADPGLPNDAVSLMREHRLYQADWLLRFYGFEVGELFAEDPNLDRDIDPKLAWALRHRALFPVDLNRAPKEMLLRVPGLGERNVKRLLVARRTRRLRTEDLKALRVSLKKVAPFVLGAEGSTWAHRELDRANFEARFRPVQKAEQLSLFDAA